MRLYHGTSERYLAPIMKDGIIPRASRKGNWSHSIESNPNAVYLTNAYAVFYAQSAIEKGEKLLVLEIETDRLLPWRLTPDEDFLEQATRNQEVTDDKGKVLKPHLTMRKRTLWFRKRLLQFSHHWEDSLGGLGNCCYHAPIVPKAITRYATLPSNCRMSFAVDPCMTLLNYAIMGGYYRQLTRLLFNEEVDYNELGIQADFFKTVTRDEVELFNN